MKVWADVAKGRIYGERAWYRGIKDDARSVGGLVYDAKTRVYSWPLTMGTCNRLREVYGDDLEVGAGLLAWAREERSGKAAVGTLSRAIGEAVKARPYQLAGAQEIARRRNIAVLDDPGLGKTLQVLAGLQLAGVWEGRHLVICPKTAINATWSEEIHRWSDGQVFPVTGSISQKRAMVQRFLEASRGPRFMVTNPETLRTWLKRWCPRCDRWLPLPETLAAEHEGVRGHSQGWRIHRQDIPEIFNVEWDSVIADECHGYMLGLRPQTGKMPLWGEGMVRLTAKRKIAMTGTPYRGREQNIFGILHWLEPAKFSGFWTTFINPYFATVDNGYGLEIAGLLPAAERQFFEMLDQHTLRRQRAEVRSDLPDNLYLDHWVQMSAAHKRQYDTFEAAGYAELESGTLRSMGVLSKLTRLKQMAFGPMLVRGDKVVPHESPKLDWLIAALEARGLVYSGQSFGEKKFIVASQFTSVLDWVEERLNAREIETLKITGAVTGPERDRVVKAFQLAGGARVLLLNTMAGGVSITLDAHCDEMFLLDETFVEDDQVQLRGRIDNRGQRVAPRTYHYIRTRGTIDERMAETNLEQAEMEHHLLDGRRGMALAAQLMGRSA